MTDTHCDLATSDGVFIGVGVTFGVLGFAFGRLQAAATGEKGVLQLQDQ